MSIIQGFKDYHSAFGMRGVVAISSHRLVGLPKVISTRPKGMLHPVNIRMRTSDLAVYKEILLQGEYDFELPAPPKVIVDAGANIGMASLYYAQRYPEATIIAIEAEASNFAALAGNVFHYPNIFPIHAALWNKDGEISIAEPDPASGAHGKWGFVVRERGGSNKVRAITMRTLMSEMKIDHIDLLKIDIEGAEKEVFEQFDWIENVDCLVIELHDRFKPGCKAAVEAATGGFSTLEKGEMTFYQRKTGRS